VIHRWAQPLERNVFQRHAAPVVAHYHRGPRRIRQLEELNDHFGCVRVVAVLDQFDQADSLIADEVLTKNCNQPGPRTECELMRRHGVCPGWAISRRRRRLGKFPGRQPSPADRITWP